jgi:hypothetical protein
MTDETTGIAWCGRPIEELSREELIEVISYLFAEVNRLRDTPATVYRHTKTGRTFLRYGIETTIGKEPQP